MYGVAVPLLIPAHSANMLECPSQPVPGSPSPCHELVFCSQLPRGRIVPPVVQGNHTGPLWKVGFQQLHKGLVGQIYVIALLCLFGSRHNFPSISVPGCKKSQSNSPQRAGVMPLVHCSLWLRPCLEVSRTGSGSGTVMHLPSLWSGSGSTRPLRLCILVYPRPVNNHTVLLGLNWLHSMGIA